MSALWVRSAWLVICGDGDETSAACNPHPTKLPPLGEGWGVGFRTSKWSVARGLWKHRNTTFRMLTIIRPAHTPPLPRTTYCVIPDSVNDALGGYCLAPLVWMLEVDLDKQRLVQALGVQDIKMSWPM